MPFSCRRAAAAAVSLAEARVPQMRHVRRAIAGGAAPVVAWLMRLLRACAVLSWLVRASRLVDGPMHCDNYKTYLAKRGPTVGVGDLLDGR